MKPVYLHTLFWALFGLCVVEGLSGCNVAVGKGNTASSATATTPSLSLDSGDLLSDQAAKVQPIFGNYNAASVSSGVTLTPNPLTYALNSATYSILSVPGNSADSVLGLAGTYISGAPLLMVYQAELSDLSPSTAYWVKFPELDYVSGLPTGCSNGDGAEQVELIAGAETSALTSSTISDVVTISPDITAPTNSLSLGAPIITGQGCGTNASLMTGTATSGQAAMQATTDSSGNMWIFFGAQTQYVTPGSVTQLYFSKVKISLTPAN